MKMHPIWDTIDFPTRDFSLVLVKPREKFLDWLNTFAIRKGLQKYRLYVPEENSVLVIPNIDRFSEAGSLDEFLDEFKPKLLIAELSRFQVAHQGDFGYPITKDTFDEFFAIELRDAASIRFLSDFKNVAL